MKAKGAETIPVGRCLRPKCVRDRRLTINPTGAERSVLGVPDGGMALQSYGQLVYLISHVRGSGCDKKTFQRSMSRKQSP